MCRIWGLASLAQQNIFRAVCMMACISMLSLCVAPVFRGVDRMNQHCSPIVPTFGCDECCAVNMCVQEFATSASVLDVEMLGPVVLCIQCFEEPPTTFMFVIKSV